MTQRILSISSLRRSTRIIVKFNFNFLVISFNALNKYLYFNSFYKSNEKKIIYDYLKIDAIYITFRRKQIIKYRNRYIFERDFSIYNERLFRSIYITK